MGALQRFYELSHQLFARKYRKISAAETFLKIFTALVIGDVTEIEASISTRA